MLASELRKSNRQIKQHTENLEAEVSSRTKKLVDTLKALEKSDRAKSDFLCQVSHELRTPLNSVVGFTKRIERQLDDSGDEKMRYAIGAVSENSRHLLFLINDLLDSALIGAGRLKLHRINHPFQKTFDEVYVMMRCLAEDKGLVLEMHEVSVETFCYDANRVKQIMVNLVTNAIKFTEKGKVTVKSKARVNNGFDGVEISVCDTGIGIEETEVGKIFDEFEQLKEIKNLGIDGVGLGLSIVRNLVELHDGTIDVISEKGCGTCFYVWLPLK